MTIDDHVVPSQGRFDDDGFYRVSDWEILTGSVTGVEPGDTRPDLVLGAARRHFEDALLAALQRPPCVIAFSGGRDSSAVLCVATDLARREGLPPPLPVTHDFSGYGRADETQWQELVIRQLSLDDWLRISDVDAFDVLGSRARAGLQRYGLLWPALIHCHAPLVEIAAGGGSLVVGEGGDEVLGAHRMTPITYLLQGRRPSRRVLGALAASIAPLSLRRRMCLRDRSDPPMLPWLADEVQRVFLEQIVSEDLAAPLRWDRAVRRLLDRRTEAAATRNLELVLADSEVTYHRPFLDPGFVWAFTDEGGARGFGTRTQMMKRLFGDVVPDAICERTNKGSFGAVAVGQESRDFLSSWTGEGLDPRYIDGQAFREACAREVPPFGVQLLLQSTWLELNTKKARSDACSHGGEV